MLVQEGLQTEAPWTERRGQMWLGGESFRKHMHYQRRINHAHRRYLSAIQSLAQVRRLGGKPVQVNIGNQQVNVSR